MLRTIKTWEGSTWFIMNTYLTFVNIFFSCLCQDYKMVTIANLYRMYFNCVDRLHVLNVTSDLVIQVHKIHAFVTQCELGGN